MVTWSKKRKCNKMAKRHVRPHCGRTRAAVLVPIRPEDKACWRSVGPHGECGFDAGGLPARFRKRPRAGALRSAGVHAAQRRSLLKGRRRCVGWATLGYHSGRNARECGGTSLVPAIFTKFMTESLPFCPLLGGGAAKGGPDSRRGSGRAALGTRGRIPADSGLGTGYPDGRERGEPKGTVESRPPRYTLTPD